MRTRAQHRQLAVGTAQVVLALTQQVSFMREALPHSPPYPDNLISISFGQEEDNSDSDKENPFFQAFASEKRRRLHQPLVTTPRSSGVDHKISAFVSAPVVSIAGYRLQSNNTGRAKIISKAMKPV